MSYFSQKPLSETLESGALSRKGKSLRKVWFPNLESLAIFHTQKYPVLHPKNVFVQVKASGSLQ